MRPNPMAPRPSEEGRLLVLAEHVLERPADLPHRRVRLDGLDDGRRDVLLARRRLPHRVERPPAARAVAPRPQLSDRAPLLRLVLRVELVRLHPLGFLLL